MGHTTITPHTAAHHRMATSGTQWQQQQQQQHRATSLRQAKAAAESPPDNEMLMDDFQRLLLKVRLESESCRIHITEAAAVRARVQKAYSRSCYSQQDEEDEEGEEALPSPGALQQQPWTTTAAAASPATTNSRPTSRPYPHHRDFSAATSVPLPAAAAAAVASLKSKTKKTQPPSSRAVKPPAAVWRSPGPSAGIRPLPSPLQQRVYHQQEGKFSSLSAPYPPPPPFPPAPASSSESLTATSATHHQQQQQQLQQLYVLQQQLAHETGQRLSLEAQLGTESKTAQRRKQQILDLEKRLQEQGEVNARLVSEKETLLGRMKALRSVNGQLQKEVSVLKRQAQSWQAAKEQEEYIQEMQHRTVVMSMRQYAQEKVALAERETARYKRMSRVLEQQLNEMMRERELLLRSMSIMGFLQPPPEDEEDDDEEEEVEAPPSTFDRSSRINGRGSFFASYPGGASTSSPPREQGDQEEEVVVGYSPPPEPSPYCPVPTTFDEGSDHVQRSEEGEERRGWGSK